MTFLEIIIAVTLAVVIFLVLVVGFVIINENW